MAVLGDISYRSTLLMLRTTSKFPTSVTPRLRLCENQDASTFRTLRLSRCLCVFLKLSNKLAVSRLRSCEVPGQNLSC